MKKVLFLAFLFTFIGSSAMALSPEEEKKVRYEELKAYKQQQREARLVAKENPKQAAQGEPTFWQKEGERSGLNRFSTNNFFKNLNPVPFFKKQQDQYNARKAAAAGEVD